MKAPWEFRGSVIIAVLLLSATMVQAQGMQLLVTNVQAQQRQFTTLVDVTYDIETVGDLPVWVSLFLSTDSGATFSTLCRTVTGDVGAGVFPGTVRHIVWNVGTDFPADFTNQGCRLRVTAYDGESVEDYAYVAPGNFMMGSPEDEPERTQMETQHQVTLTHGIYVQTTEVTNQQYMEMAQWAYDQGYATATSASIRDNLDGSTRELLLWNSGNCNISFNGGTFIVEAGKEDYPVMDVTWYGAVAYCDWLSLRQGRTRAYSHISWQCNRGNPYAAMGYRLPTEAEWEYACRAGTQTPFATGTCLDAGTEANYHGANPYPGCPTGPYVGWTTPVGSYPANAFGLYDMHGNLYEWCNDLMDSYGGTVTDPVGASTGTSRVLRGGYWNIYAQYCRSAARYDSHPEHSSQYRGFRAVQSADLGAPQYGTITIDPEPNNLNAPWNIAGPNAFSQSGTGDSWLTNMTPGDYSLTWGAVAGWTPPALGAVTQTLAANETITFGGTYVTQSGMITINPDPDIIDAPWQITGPNAFSWNAAGDTTLTNMIAGDYTLTWGAVSGWTMPSPVAVTQTLASGGVETFTGLYVVETGTPVGFVSMPPGTFMMGSPTTELLRGSDETQHQVTLTHGIYVGPVPKHANFNEASLRRTRCCRVLRRHIRDRRENGELPPN